MPPPNNRHGLDQIAAQLDEALRDALIAAPDPRLQKRARRLRTSGTALLGLACACMAAVALLPVAELVIAIGPLMLSSSAIALLLAGGWLIDKAGKEAPGSDSGVERVLQGALSDTPTAPSNARIERQRQFGISMLVLAGFSICVVPVPWRGKQAWDVMIWGGFAVTLIVVGAWHLVRATRMAIQTCEMAAAAQRRMSANGGGHIQRVK
jgi:hypothetical protein